jgi:predicted alpha/beta superfamily hydrolase
VGIGYPETIPDSPYSEGRYYDYQIPVCPTCPPPPPDQPGVPSNGENFLTFIDEVLRPWIRQAFPNVKFNRDALYGHSFAGLFTIYTLIEHAEMFDVYLSASPFLYWNNEYIFSLLWPLKPGLQHGKGNGKTKPALQISYGGYEQDFPKRRTETHKEHQERKAFLSQFKYADLTERLYAEVKDSPALRHVELNVYPFSYHAAVGAAALNDGIDYFLDW